MTAKPEEQTETILERLAVSHALAQSVRLCGFEESIQATITATRHLPRELAIKGSISASRRSISQKLGRLFQTRHEVYLHSDMLSTPDFFWEYSSLEPPYLVSARYLEIEQRRDNLSKRLTVVQELYDLLSHELQYKHSSKLEVIIIVLIAFEILLTLIKDFVAIVAALRPKTNAP
eukprot:CAMPEP_0198320628 /NCGR_PEP_ID=MMETSP1450-20131203/9529_1 /TAXON_ID=753684 ORGANISM="Madagascaria erythrocladiodes, Strain CCMP3234" /NCGR_SAMPLE_ID=MMETSP1450 /ASSEMBLY_ACC=CAM_ASM_001115 /LENGTH=175 /DNA_ID=CAMNT_0044024117 /DNA_START=22 /DNA_END=545 /DNA_ORIENTATION=-